MVMASREQSGRSEQACQSCRQLKARCTRSEEPGRCQRCRDFNRACIWPESRARRRVRPRASGIARVENKIDSLVSQMSSSHGSSEVHTRREYSVSTTGRENSTTRTDLHTPISQDFEPSSVGTQSGTAATSATTLDDLARIHDFSARLLETRSPSLDPTVAAPDIFRGLVTDQRLEELLDSYRHMSSSFPFVPIRSDLKASVLRRSKPMLLVAIAATAASQDRSLQVQLDQRYREELALHTIIAPRKSVGLVQSLLVYLAWYHFFFSHKTQNIFPMLQLLIGLTIDIGLHHDKNRKPTVETLPEQQRERDRALLGCQFLDSSISAALRKPALFERPRILDACLLRLAEAAEFESDASIPILLSCSTLDLRVNGFCQELRDETLMIPVDNVTIIEAELQRFIKSVAGSRSNDVVRTPELLSHSATMELHNVTLQRKVGIDGNQDSGNVSQCLDPGRSFLELLLEHPVHSYNFIPFVVWARLPVTIITLSTLSLLPEMATNDRRPRLELYLEALCNRMQILTTSRPPQQPLPDFWKAMFVIMDQARMWYVDRLKSLNQIDGSAVQTKTTFCPVNLAGSPGDGPEGPPDMWSSEQPNTHSFDDFLTMDWWGGSEGYDPTIIGFDDVIQ